MKKAVMYGAGNIGRGFIGQLLSQSGYEVVFIDVNAQVVDKLNQDRCYPIKFATDEGNYELTIENVRAVNGLDIESVAREISEADVMATAVGVNVLPAVAAPIAKGLIERWRCNNMKPLNIIICENLMDANHYLKALVKKEMKQDNYEHLDQLIGFVEASIGRMVPVMTTEMQEGNILRVCVETYDRLPVDKDGFKGQIPEIKNLVPFSPFKYYIHRKLFIHNMGHAMAAYLGYLSGYNYIWEAIEDPRIKEKCYCAMSESAHALSQEHGVEISEIMAHVNQLLERFGNRQLGDTVERVGRDLQRKLAPNDRLIGALNLCIKNGIEPVGIVTGIIAALQFKDSMASEVVTMLEQNEVEKILLNLCSLSKGSMAYDKIVEGFKSTI
ncbi:MAG: mannitol dehydrogenase [Vallitaleaceae bacterium]|nr:mannitol dehydrogenase [Vallitaleaceae bacterium]